MREEPTTLAEDGRAAGDAAVSAKPALIVAAARKLFLTAGYAETSMDAIAAEAGVSKATVYSHFQSKEALFAGVMGGMCAETGREPLPDTLAGPLEAVLRSVGRDLLGHLADPQAMALVRTVASAAGQFPALGRMFWQQGPDQVQNALADYLADPDPERGAGPIAAEPRQAAALFFGLVSGPFLLPILLGVRQVPSQAECDSVLDAAVASFVAGLRPPARADD